MKKKKEKEEEEHQNIQNPRQNLKNIRSKRIRASSLASGSSNQKKEVIFLLKELESLKISLKEKNLVIENAKKKIEKEKLRNEWNENLMESKDKLIKKKDQDLRNEIELRKSENKKMIQFKNRAKIEMKKEKDLKEKIIGNFEKRSEEEKRKYQHSIQQLILREKKKKEKRDEMIKIEKQRFERCVLLEKKVFVKKIEEEKRKNERLKSELNEKLSTQTRLGEKIQEITNEEFWTYNPTKYASLNTGKLEFHHNIFKFPKFICRFMKERSKYQNEESYEEMRRACRYFENVVVSLSNDHILKKFIDETKKKYMSNIRKEMIKKESHLSQELKNIIQHLILDVSQFFFPPKYDKRTSKPNMEKIRKFIEESQKKRGGNQLFLGDLKHKFGACRHHATLLKLVCDSLGILCKLECIEEFHAWNLIQLKEEFIFVDLTNFPNKLFGVSEYYDMLESNIENLQVNKVQERLIRKLVISKRIERKQIEKLQKYVQNPSQFMEDVFPLPSQKGGFGDVMLLKIRKNVMMIPSNERLFKKGEVIAIKKILVKNEDDISSDGIPRRYAIREASHMKILDHSSIIRVIGYWESRDENNVPHVYIAMNGMDQDGRGFLHTLNNKAIEEMTKIQKLTEVIIFLIETARGLRYLSTLNIVHLDLKLENVMIQWDGQKNEILDVRIIDFGGAKNNDIQTSNFMTTEGYDSPEIRDIKTMKKIRENIQKIKTEMNNSIQIDRDRIENLVNSTSSKFWKLSQMIHVKELEEEFILLCKICEEHKFRFGSEVKERVEKRILAQKCVEEVSSSSSTIVKFFDCRADVYSFGVMMDEFLREGLLPQELRYLQEKCIEFDRRDRPSIDEIIYVLKQHLSFFNEKMKVERN